ncbi:hypothetical protein TNCV_1769221 [Trichonephila clavipes]|nr:hypothetical protein TNCV_1769221 [Trichonephila clavipes]
MDCYTLHSRIQVPTGERFRSSAVLERTMQRILSTQQCRTGHREGGGTLIRLSRSRIRLRRQQGKEGDCVILPPSIYLPEWEKTQRRRAFINVTRIQEDRHLQTFRVKCEPRQAVYYPSAHCGTLSNEAREGGRRGSIVLRIECNPTVHNARVGV